MSGITGTFAWLGAAVVAAAAVGWLAWRQAGPPRYCPDGMTQLGWRCCGEGQTLAGDRCTGRPRRCAIDQDPQPDGCIPRRATITWFSGCDVGRTPIDWDGSMPPIHTAPFRLDTHERTEADYQACVAAGVATPAPVFGEPGLPQTGVSASDAARCCANRGVGGRLPSVAELACTAMGSSGRRYSWGDSGAVCRRVAYGLFDGPCARGADRPQLVGSYPEGATPGDDSRVHVYDLAGNVAEWATSGSDFVVVGGSWREANVSALRSFSSQPTAPETRATTIGFRCAFPAGGP